MSRTRAKTVPGAPVTSLDMLIRMIDSEQWFYVNGRVQHPAIVYNFNLSLVRNYIRNGRIRKAMDASNPSRFYVSRKRVDE